MSASKQKRKLYTFLFFFVVSLVGNACADYAILWYGISKLDDPNSTKELLSSFYVGQAIGFVVLAPLLSAFVDRTRRIFSSIALDLVYAGLLLGMILLYRFEHLHPFAVLTVSTATAALSALHKSSVGYGALKKLSEELDTTSIVTRFSAALNITVLIGSVLSGFTFKTLGFEGCIWIGVWTFLPMPFVYLQIFDQKEKGQRSSTTRKLIHDLREGLTFLKLDSVLLRNAISVAVLNISSSIFPAVVAIAFQINFPDRTDLASLAIAVAIFGGTLSLKFMGPLAKQITLKSIIPISLIPTILALLLTYIFPHALVYAVAFFVSCCGSALRNVAIGVLRVNRIPTELTSRVNTAYFSIISLGQVLGGAVVIPAGTQSLGLGTSYLILALSIATAFGWFTLPATPVSDAGSSSLN